MNVTLVAGVGILLAGCASGKFVTLPAAGQDFPQADYQVLGQTRYDQTWIDKTIEAEVAGFGFKRPAKRPASLAVKKPKPCPVCAKPVSDVKTEAAPAKPAKKKLFQRLKEKLKGQ